MSSQEVFFAGDNSILALLQLHDEVLENWALHEDVVQLLTAESRHIFEFPLQPLFIRAVVPVSHLKEDRVRVGLRDQLVLRGLNAQYLR